jgi:hypothetical protein
MFTRIAKSFFGLLLKLFRTTPVPDFEERNLR